MEAQSVFAMHLGPHDIHLKAEAQSAICAV
jgi:hypothetical protein